MTSTLTKAVKTITTAQPPAQVWVAAVTAHKSDIDAQLTHAGYLSVKDKYAVWGYNWTPQYQFEYWLINTAFNGGSSHALDSFGNPIVIPTGWSVLPLSRFANGEIPPAMAIPDSYSDTPVGGANVTIPAHYEWQATAPIVTYSQNLGWNAGACSALALKGDGYITFRLDDTNTGSVAGLSDSSGGNTQGHTNITHGIKSAGNQFQIVELGTTKTTAASFATADVFKIAVVAGVVTYYKNATLIYTSLTAHDDNYWLFDCSLYEADDALYDADFMAGYLGDYVDLTALQTAYPAATTDSIASIGDVIYIFDGVDWIDSGTTTTSDPLLLRIVTDTQWTLETPHVTDSDWTLSTAALTDTQWTLITGRVTLTDSAWTLAIPRITATDTTWTLTIARDTHTVTDTAWTLIIGNESDKQSLVIDIHNPETPVYGTYLNE